MADQRLEVQPRSVLGKRVKQLRRAGVLPAVIFGHGGSIPIQVDAHAFERAYRRWGGTTLVTLTGIDGDIPVLVHEVSRDPRTGRLVHADFFRVSLTEKAHAEVPLHFVGDSAALKAGGVLLHAMDHVRVEALPQDIPHRIDVELSPLETLEDAIHVRELVVDASKVKILNDADELVVKVVIPRAEAVPAPAAAPEAEAVAAAEAPVGEAEAEAEAAQPTAAGPTQQAKPAQAAKPAPQPKKS